MPKKKLRSSVLALRDSMDMTEIAEKSRIIKERLLGLEEFLASRTVLFFLSFGKEVRTEEMVRESLALGKNVLVPKTDTQNHRLILSRLLDYDADLAPGVWGIPEPRPEALRPVDAKEVDLVIVPGVAFDMEGNRLGYGGGYYDRLFPTLKKATPLVALAFACQLVATVPTEEFDRQIDCLLTEKNIHYFEKNS
jgi:5-formyltetrahydrofolate cyclo-ligase